MACSSCGGRKIVGIRGTGQRGVEVKPQSVVMPSNAIYSTTEWVMVAYNGHSVDHFIGSPTNKVRYYSYGKRGDVIPVHADDVRLKPERFAPVSIEEAQKAWPRYPVGAPDWLVDKLGVPPVPDEPVYVALSEGEEGIPFSEPPVEELPEVALTARVTREKKKANKKKGR